MANFNINTKQLSDTAMVDLLDPATGSPLFADEAETLPLQIEVYGRSSKVYRKWQAETSRKALLRGKKVQSPEAQKEDTADFLATISKAAYNFDQDGEPIDSYEAFKKLYLTDSLYWIGDLVALSLSDLEGFLQK